MSALVYSSSLIAAFLGGVLALFAPCCVVSLLPTFVGAALERGRLRLPAMAAIFAAGIASVMLPIVLGVGLLGQLLAAQHRVIFFVVGLFLVLLALQVVSGRPWSLPFPMLRLRVSGSTPGGIFALGLTAGVASSCCAPVLAGVVALSALASSVTGALGLGLAYVFGMVFAVDRRRCRSHVSRHRDPRLGDCLHRTEHLSPRLVGGMEPLGDRPCRQCLGPARRPADRSPGDRLGIYRACRRHSFVPVLETRPSAWSGAPGQRRTGLVGARVLGSRYFDLDAGFSIAPRPRPIPKAHAGR